MLYALGSALVSLLHSVFSLQGIKHVLRETDENEYLLNIVPGYTYSYKKCNILFDSSWEYEENSGKPFYSRRKFVCFYSYLLF